MIHYYRCAFGLLILLASATASAYDFPYQGHFCPSCTNESSAQQKALEFAPPGIPSDCGIVPYGYIGDDEERYLVDELGLFPATDSDFAASLSERPECRSGREIGLLNHNTGQTFVYLVYWSGPDFLATHPISISAGRENLYQDLIGIRHAWDSIRSEPVVELDNGHGSIASTPSIWPCPPTPPDGTALDQVVNQNFRAKALDRLRRHVGRNLSDYVQSKPRIIGGRIGARAGSPYAGLYGEVDIEPPDRFDNAVTLVAIGQNELGFSGDFLVFGVDVLDAGFGDVAAIIQQLIPEASVVLGHPLDRLLAGDIVIENDCVKDKLDSYHPSQVPPGSPGIGIEFIPNNPFDGWCKRIVRYSVYVDGVLANIVLGTQLVPCDMP